MTEDEAKTKWCPFARRLFDWNEETSYNRRKDDTPGSLCIASACMAWRWFDDIEDGKLHRYTHKSEHGSSAEILKDVSLRRGFCGLAGPPQ